MIKDFDFWTIGDFTRQQLSLLLYLETCAVDRGGRVDLRRMNAAEVELAKSWANAGFLEFGRIASEDVDDRGSMYVRLSNSAFNIAHEGRKARAAKGWETRQYKTTGEKRQQAVEIEGPECPQNL